MNRKTTVMISLALLALLLGVAGGAAFAGPTNLQVAARKAGQDPTGTRPAENAREPTLRVASPVTGTVRYTVTDLGFGGALSLNEAGQVVGYPAFLWLPEPAYGLPAGLHDLNEEGCIDCVSADGINEDGQIVGLSWSSGAPRRAFLWQNGSMQDLGTLGGPSSRANDINNNGQVTGYADLVVEYEYDGEVITDTISHAFLWQNGSMSDLGDLGNDEPQGSHGLDINNVGQVVGWSDTDNDIGTAFLWNGEMSALTSPGSANGINEAGEVVGSSFSANVNAYHAFLWLPAPAYGLPAGMNDLGALGGSGSDAYAMNNAGQVVGAAADGNNQLRAFVWENGMMTDLNDLVDADSGWELTTAYDINDAGQIVGIGWLDGQQHAFLLTPEDQCQALPVSAPATNAPSALNEWLNATGGAFDDPDNWSNGVPGVEDVALFGLGGAQYEVTLSQDVTNDALAVGSGDHLTLDLGGNTYTLNGESDCYPSIMVGFSSEALGNLWVHDGTVEVNEDVLLGGGGAHPYNGLYLYEGSYLLLDADGDGTGSLVVGREVGHPVGVEIEEDSFIHSPIETLLGPEAGTTGILYLDDNTFDESPEFSGGRLVVGQGGQGTLEMTTNSIAELTELVVAQQGGATGAVILDASSQLRPDSLKMAVAPGAEASMTVGGGSLNFVQPQQAEVGIGGTGSVTVTASVLTGGDWALGVETDGEGSLVLNSGGRLDQGSLVIGQGGRGDLQVTGGSEVGAVEPLTDVWLGQEAGSFGSAYVGGIGSRLVAQQLTVGGAGFGLLNVDAGGVVQATTLSVGQQGTVQGAVTFVGGSGPSQPAAYRPATGGDIHTRSLFLNQGGTLAVETVLLQPGGLLGGDGTLAMSLTNEGTLNPGGPGAAGTFTVAGDYSQAEGGVLDVELTGAAHDQLLVTGSATLSGLLRSALPLGHGLSVGDELVVLRCEDSATCLEGAFETVEQPCGGRVSVLYGEEEVRIRIDEVTAPCSAQLFLPVLLQPDE